MDQTTAGNLLRTLIDSGRKLDPMADDQRERWQLDGRAVLERVFGVDSRQLKEFVEVSWAPDFITPHVERNRQYTIEGRQRGRRRSVTVLESALNEVDQFWELDQAISNVDHVRLIERLCNRFHGIARQMRNRHSGRPTLDVHDEYDVQDLVHALLLLDFDDVRPEEWTPSYAGASSRMDFLLKRERTVLELKRSRKGLGAREVGEQLMVDLQRYRTHPDCELLVCFVYDPEGILSNPRGFENDLSTTAGVPRVKVLIRP